MYSQLLLAKLLFLKILLVGGDYTLEITLESYGSNNRCAECVDEGFYGCCDNWESRNCGSFPGASSSQCETYFEYCLFPSGTTTTSRWPLTCTPIVTSNPTANGALINFSQSTVLGLPNPLTFDGISNSWTGVVLQVVPMDYDSSGPDDTIDVFRVDLVNRNGSVALSGTFGLSTLAFSYRVICGSGFYGDMCQHFNDCPSTDVCGPNGVCVDGDSTFTCQCDPGFTGSTCLQSIDDCIGVTCSGHGRCVDEMNAYTCVCDAGYTGGSCNVNIDDCVGANCGENGQCVDGINSYTCACDVGYTGGLCNVNIDDCVGANCGENGQCVDGINSYTCACDVGYTGGLCNVNIDDCIGANCGENGQCVDGINSYTCACDAGYTGGLCNVNIDDCIGANCSENGQCVDAANTITCMCDPGFTGDWCEASINDCTDNSCSGNGDCIDGVNSFSCECIDGYIGDFCETLVVNQTSNCSEINCNSGLGSGGGGLDHQTLTFILVGSLGGSAVLLCLVIACLVMAVSCACRKSKSRDGHEIAPTPAKQGMALSYNERYDLSEGYGDFAAIDDVIYEEISDEMNFDDELIGSRHHGHGVYEEGLDDMDTYSVYDVVL